MDTGITSKPSRYIVVPFSKDMVTSSNGNIFRVTGPLWGESNGHQGIPLTKASNAERWCFLWCAPQQTAEETIEMLVISDAMAIIITSVTVMYLDVKHVVRLIWRSEACAQDRGMGCLLWVHGQRKVLLSSFRIMFSMMLYAVETISRVYIIKT